MLNYLINLNLFKQKNVRVNGKITIILAISFPFVSLFKFTVYITLRKQTTACQQTSFGKTTLCTIVFAEHAIGYSSQMPLFWAKKI